MTISHHRRAVIRRLAAFLVVVVGLGWAGCDQGTKAPALPKRPDLRRLPAAFATALAKAESAANDAPEGRRARLTLGQLYQANQFEAEAADCYRPLASDPDVGAKANYYLGLLALGQDDLGQGIERLRACGRQAPDYVPAQLHLADACYKSGQVAEATAVYAAVLRRDSGNLYALLATAREALRQGDATQAAKLLEGLTAAHPDFGAGCALYAQVLERAGERERAAAMRLRARARKDPPAPDPWGDEMMQHCFDLQSLSMRFEDYAKAGRIDESLLWLQRIEAVDPHYWLVCQVRGLALADKGRFAEAVAEYERALAAGGDAAKLYPALVGTLTGMKRFAEADAKAETGLAAAPGTPALLVAVAQLREAEARPVDAERLLSEALALEPRNTSANRALARIWWGRGAKEQALPLLRLVMETAPGDLVTRGMVGEFLLEQGRPADALEPLREARALAPGNENIADLLTVACLRIGNEEARAGRTAEALAAYDRAIAARPQRPEALTNKARLCVQLGRFGPAEEALERLVKLQPENPGAWLALGDVQNAAGRSEAARSNWTQALQWATGDAYQNLRVAARERLQRAVAR